MTTPSDPLYDDQWHFSLIGNIESIWNDYDGTGVNVGVYDDGVDYNHQDLKANYDASLHVVDNFGNAIDPFPIKIDDEPDPPSDPDDGHGTACAGIIGAADNGVGGVGVAHGVKLTGVNIDFDNTGLYGSINSFDYAPFVDIVKQAAENFDIMSNSWGAPPGYFSGNGLADGGYATAVNAAYDTLVDEGRDGLGTIIVQAAGNNFSDANGDGLNASRFTITVAATGQDGFVADYSNFGSCILVTAPAASVTTDVSGLGGYDSGNYTSTFGGTSAATPVVSGVIALMLDANDGLGWRDVQNILAASATLTGSGLNSPKAGFEDGTWYVNAGNNWNGGGNHVHTNYGYGMVNVYNAVRMAEVWGLFGAAQTSANEQVVTSGLKNLGGTVVPPGLTGFSTNFTINADVAIEHVSLTLDLQTTYVGDMRIVLTSADGTVVEVAQNSFSLSNDVNGNWVFGIESLRGELSGGTWTLQVFDAFSSDPLTVYSAKLDVYGSAPTVNDVYHFTSEFSVMAGSDNSRRTISDTDGGIDWVNAAAVSTGSIIRLNGGTSTIDGVAVTISTAIENAIGGDGGDTLIGNGSNNRLHGMRGNDTINSGAGNDRLDGGRGNDTMLGGAGNDTYIVNSASDRVFETTTTSSTINAGGLDTVQSAVSFNLGATAGVRFVENLTLTGSSSINGTGNALNNRLVGNSGNNVLNGVTGTDTLIGGAGSDTYITNGSDTITEAAGQGIDTVRSSVSLTLGANLEKLVLTGTSAINGTGNSANNSLTGNSGNNILNGAAGSDTLIGGAGNDTYITNGSDTITEAAGQGTDTVRSSVNMALGAHLENLVLTGTSAINGAGNAFNNSLTGNSANNVLNGGLGSDLLTGGGGADNFVFNSALGASNIDRIADFNAVADTIRLENAIFAGLAAGTLAATAFASNTSGNAADASDRIIYESDTGRLYFDSDGTGAAAKVHFATLTTGLSLTNADFFVF